MGKHLKQLDLEFIFCYFMITTTMCDEYHTNDKLTTVTN